jgi:hypothetical protein
MLNDVLRTLCDALVGRQAVAPDDAIVEHARAHRIDAVLAARNGHGPARAAVAKALADERAIAEVCEAARRGGVDLLILKGAALAYTHYPHPHQRPHDDIDLFIRRRDRRAMTDVLASLGYLRDAEADAEIWTGQSHYTRQTPAGTNVIDLHWRVVNPVAFTDTLQFETAWHRSVAVGALGAAARTLSSSDSLLLACIHRVAHHGDRIELLWLWDIHLLVSRMTHDEFEEFETCAFQARAARVCARGLDLAVECFGTPVPAELLGRLKDAPDEPTAAFLGEPLRPLDVALEDFSALTGWRERATLIREHLLPPAAYMRQRYPGYPAVLLPFAYFHRIASGAPRWLRR